MAGGGVIVSADRPAAVSFDDVVAERVAALRRRVAAVAGDRPVTIVAVTKGFGAAAPRAARRAGLADLGENYGRELLAKAQAIQGGSQVRWHFLGAVQRRKVRLLASHVHLWQSVDREAAGAEIARWAPGAAVLVQVELSGLPGRNGCAFDGAPVLVERLRSLGLDVRGLMAVASPDEPRPEFRRLARLAGDLGLPELSMGMTGDLEIALDEGATMLRVGRALFGPRPVHDLPGRRD